MFKVGNFPSLKLGEVGSPNYLHVQRALFNYLPSSLVLKCTGGLELLLPRELWALGKSSIFLQKSYKDLNLDRASISNHKTWGEVCKNKIFSRFLFISCVDIFKIVGSL